MSQHLVLNMISELPAQGLDQTRSNHYTALNLLVRDIRASKFRIIWSMSQVEGSALQSKKIFGFGPVILAVSDPV